MLFFIARTSGRSTCSEEPPAPSAVRTKDLKGWQIELTDLEQLTKLIDTLEEPLILSRRQGVMGPTTIEIYDDMREEHW